jgi:Uma2 family endonuclease
VHFRKDVLVPDLAGWRRVRLPRLPATAYFSVAPDWVCEVVSPSTVALDRAKKLSIYGREGVCHLWLIDPVARVVEVFRLVRGRWTVAATHAGNETVRLEPFNQFELDLSALWSDEAAAPAAKRAKRPPRPGRRAR